VQEHPEQLRTSINSTNSNPREGEEKPRNWLEAGMGVLDSAGRITDANESLVNWLARLKEDVLGKSFREILSALSTESDEALDRLAKRAETFATVRLRLTSGADRPAQWLNLEIARTETGSFVRLNSILPPLSELEESVWNEHLQNDSARREMFMRLLRAEAQLDSLMRRWPCVIFSQRPDFSMQFASPNIVELTGIPLEEWTSQSKRFWEVVHEGDAGELQQQFKRAMRTGTGITNTYRIRNALTGRIAYVLEHRQPTMSQNGLLLGYEGIWLDVTRQTVAEKRLSTAAWKETLAVLTLGMAHDFRNIMAGIHSLSESFLDQVDEKHSFHEGLSLIKKSSMQASQLVQRMIHLHLGQTGERNYHNLNEIATDLVELVSKILPRRIRVGKELCADSLPVYLDLVEFRQVVINLLLNAADAMPEGGSLTLRTARHQELPELRNMKGVKPRLPCISMSIEDTGCGINQRHLASIFDPFFTTKAKGSGLGLYNARIAIEKHQGGISVDSQEGKGTTFHIWLPEADFSEADQALVEAEKMRNARKSILLLGQPGEMLDRTAELLRSHNYHTVLASTADGVSELLASNDYQFAGVMVLVEPNDPGLYAGLTSFRTQNKKLKTILKLAGCNQDELDAQILSRGDLVLNSDISQADMLARLKSFFN
jgi:signal transduction histidine kinase